MGELITRALAIAIWRFTAVALIVGIVIGAVIVLIF